MAQAFEVLGDMSISEIPRNKVFVYIKTTGSSVERSQFVSNRERKTSENSTQTGNKTESDDPSLVELRRIVNSL